MTFNQERHNEIMHDIKVKIATEEREREYTEQLLKHLRTGGPRPKITDETHIWLNEQIYQKNLKEDHNKKELARIREQFCP